MLINFVAALVTLHALHSVGDHWVQTDCQAQRKGNAGWAGRRACAGHVATYGALQLAGLVALMIVFDLRLSVLSLAAGMLVNIGTHYIADRRTPLRWVAAHWPREKVGYYDNGGAYELDQAWHKFWIFVSSIIIAL